MLSIAAIDARCFLEPRETTPAIDLDWAWLQAIGPQDRSELRPAEAEAATLNSLILRHFALAAA